MRGACGLWLRAPRPTALRPAPLCPLPCTLCQCLVEALGVQRGRQKPVVRRTPAPTTPSHTAPPYRA